MEEILYPEKLCFDSLLIFAFWCLEFSLATKMKKLEDISIHNIKVNSIVLYFYYAMYLYYCGLKTNLTIIFVLNGISCLSYNLLEYGRMHRDSKRLLLFTIVHSVYTYDIIDIYYYLFTTFVIYLSFNKFLKFYFITSIPLFCYLLIDNLLSLPLFYYFISVANISLLVGFICLTTLSVTYGCHFTPGSFTRLYHTTIIEIKNKFR